MGDSIQGAYLALSSVADNPEYGGVAAKIEAQAKALNTDRTACNLHTIASPHSFWGNFFNWLPIFPTLEQWNATDELAANDFLYIRKPIFTQKFIRFLSEIKAKNPSLKIVVEIPTYPYDDEMKSFVDRVFLIRDRHNRKRLHKYVDRIADLSRHDEIFGIPTLPLINGIDLSLHTPRTPSLQESEIHILSVSCCRFWHGIDRAIAGLSEYYAADEPRKRVVLHVAGEGAELPELKKMAESLQMEDYVVFHGLLRKDELEKLYDQCTIALEGLGYFRKTDAISSSIKSREYLAKGIPFVYCTDIDVLLDEPIGFCLRVPADDSPLDIEQLASFHDQVYRSYPEDLVINRMRDYAERKVSMEAALENIVQYIEGLD